MYINFCDVAMVTFLILPMGLSGVHGLIPLVGFSRRHFLLIHHVQAPRGLSFQSMDPIALYPIPKVGCCLCLWRLMYEIQYMDFYILYSMMVCFIEMSSYDVIIRVTGHIVEVALKALHKSTFGLAHILHVAYFAANAVYEIGRFAGYLHAGDVGSPCDPASYSTQFVQLWAVSAIFSVADIAPSSRIVLFTVVGKFRSYQQITQIWRSAISMNDVA